MIASPRAAVLAIVLLALAGFAYADGSGDPKAVKSEDGKYLDKDGNPTFNVGKDGTVDYYTFAGFVRYSANCLQCHGPDALGSSYAPSLVESLKHLEPGGRLVINAIAKEERDKDYLLRLDYQKHLWLEKEIKTVANVTRRDVREFLALAAQVPIKPTVQEFPLADANTALLELKAGNIRGAKVLRIPHTSSH